MPRHLDEIAEQGGSPEARWIGYLSYDLGRLFEELPQRTVDDLQMPLFAFTLHHAPAELPWAGKAYEAAANRTLSSNFSRDAYIAALPMNIAERELAEIRRTLDIPPDQLHLQALPNDMGPGNAVTITARFENVAEVFTGFGERGVRAEVVAENAALEARRYLDASAPIGEHLGDQVLLPLALAGGGSFVTTTISQHLRSNALVIKRFIDRHIEWQAHESGYLVSLR